MSTSISASPVNISGIKAEELPGFDLTSNELFTTDSGLQYYFIKRGSGEYVQPSDRVSVHYSGWSSSRELFDSSYQRGQPAVFPVGGVIKGWTEALQLMNEGSIFKVIIPAQLAYGECPSRGGRPCGVLIFDIELISIISNNRRNPVPNNSNSENITTIPNNQLPGLSVDGLTVQQTDSGLQYFVIKAGDGKSPGRTNTVTVHYSGWDTSRQNFDNSYSRGNPLSFPLDRVIAGWTEGLQFMSEGAIFKLIIPAELAYGKCEQDNSGGRPCGILIFDVQLIKVGDSN